MPVQWHTKIEEASCVGSARSQQSAAGRALALDRLRQREGRRPAADADNDGSASPPSGDGPKIGLAYDVGGRGDQSFNDSAYAGMEKAVEDLDATCIEAEALRTRTTPPARSVCARWPRAATTRSSRSASSTRRPRHRSPPEYPDTNFAVIDGYSAATRPR